MSTWHSQHPSLSLRNKIHSIHSLICECVCQYSGILILPLILFWLLMLPGMLTFDTSLYYECCLDAWEKRESDGIHHQCHVKRNIGVKICRLWWCYLGRKEDWGGGGKHERRGGVEISSPQICTRSKKTHCSKPLPPDFLYLIAHHPTPPPHTPLPLSLTFPFWLELSLSSQNIKGCEYKNI